VRRYLKPWAGYNTSFTLDIFCIADTASKFYADILFRLSLTITILLLGTIGYYGEGDGQGRGGGKIKNDAVASTTAIIKMGWDTKDRKRVIQTETLAFVVE